MSRPHTKTHLHRLATRHAPAEAPAVMNARGIGEDLKRLRKQYPADWKFRLPPKFIDDGD